MTRKRALSAIVALSLFMFTVTQPGWGVEKVKTGEKPMTTGDGLSMVQSPGEVPGAGAVERVATTKPSATKKKGLLTALLIGGAVLTVGIAVYLILAHASKSLDENFDDGQADGWATNGYGSWQVVSGVYTFTGSGSNGENAYSWYNLADYTDFTYEARIRNGGDQAIVFRGNAASQDWYVFYAWGTQWAVFRMTGSSWSYLQNYTASPALKYYPEWNTFKVMASGTGFTLFINNVQVGVVTDAALAKGKIGFQIRNHAGVKAEYDDVRVTSN